MNLLEQPRVEQPEEQVLFARKDEIPASAQPRPLGRRLIERTRTAVDFVLGCVLGILGFVIQGLCLVMMIAAVPLLPFVLPLGLGPVVVLFGLLVVGAGAGFAALGLTPPPPPLL